MAWMNCTKVRLCIIPLQLLVCKTRIVANIQREDSFLDNVNDSFLGVFTECWTFFLSNLMRPVCII